MNASQKGFTLAELLIALALLGVIAAFTIPKVLQASGDQETVAKVREATSTLEQAWYHVKMQTGLMKTAASGVKLYDQIAGQMNTVNQGATTSVGAAGNPLVTTPAHPCASAPYNIGWLQFANGVVISGLGGSAATDDFVTTQEPPVGAARTNYVLCIDTNGAASPNQAGADIFIGNFNQWGDFDGGAVVVSQKSFNWGTNTLPVRVAAGTGPATLDSATSRVGVKLIK